MKSEITRFAQCRILTTKLHPIEWRLIRCPKAGAKLTLVIVCADEKPYVYEG